VCARDRSRVRSAARGAHVIVASCQLDIAWEDKPANHARVEALVAADPLPRGSLLALPEMFATGFSMDVARIEEGTARASERFLAQLASRHGLHVLGGVVNRGADGRGRNEAVLFGPDGSALARYCKLHPFSYAGESRHYSAGEGAITVECAGAVVAPFICYDLRFPEAFRAAVGRGAQLFVVIANWPAARESHWLTLLRARAIENQAYVVGANRCGRDPNATYSGRSLIVDPRGETLADGGVHEGIVRAEIDLATLVDYRRTFPALADMRHDFV
jgi:omega-amidase